jgi:putative peptidoglycan binding protein
MNNKPMRTLFVILCSLALVFAVNGAEENKKEQKSAPKKPAQAQGAQVRGGGARQAGPPNQTGAAQHMPQNQRGTGKATGKQNANATEMNRRAEAGKNKGQAQTTNPTNAERMGKAKGRNEATNANQPGQIGQGKGAGKGKATGQAAAGQQGASNAVAGGKPGKANVAAGKPFKPQHFNVPKQPNTAKAPPVKFQQNRHIEGSQHWQGQQYAAFRNYHSEWHDQGWWHNHYNNITFLFGAPYFFNSGYWYPAWGYSPNAYYAYDGPIYAYHNLPPDQVITNVQAALQQQGYYQGEVDGLLGPLTRSAISAYQRDHGLYQTSAIDEPTLQSLGMA